MGCRTPGTSGTGLWRNRLHASNYAGYRVVCVVPALPEHAGTGFFGESLEAARSKGYSLFR